MESKITQLAALLTVAIWLPSAAAAQTVSIQPDDLPTNITLVNFDLDPANNPVPSGTLAGGIWSGVGVTFDANDVVGGGFAITSPPNVLSGNSSTAFRSINTVFDPAVSIVGAWGFDFVLEVFDENSTSLGEVTYTDGSPGLFGGASEFGFVGLQSEVPIYSAQFRRAFPNNQVYGFHIDDLVFLSGDPGPPRVVTELVPTGSDWSYLDDGSNQAAAWRDPAFDDSAWASGPAQLGYGDNDEATVVGFGGNAGDKFATTYFRHTFTVDDLSRIEEVSALLLRDDAGAVYLNGVEIFRDDNLPDAAAFDTLATAVGVENGTVRFNVESALLVDGENVLAVEIHQVNPTSSDISFDLRLTAVVNPIPEPSSLVLGLLGILSLVKFRAGGVRRNGKGERSS